MITLFTLTAHLHKACLGSGPLLGHEIAQVVAEDGVCQGSGDQPCVNKFNSTALNNN